MKCPACSNSQMCLLFTRQGVEVDQCPACKGVWLDRGEIFHFTRHPRTIAKKLKKAQECLKEGNIKSPVSKRMMDTIIYDLEIKFYQCPESKGLWFSSGQLKALLTREKQLQLDFEKEPPVETSKGPVVPANDRQPLAKTTRRAAPLTPLSNLFAGSFLTLAGLYAVMTLVLISAVEFAGLGPKIALGAAVVIVLLQFIFSPWIMDFTLRWLYKMEFIEFDELPESSQEFIAKLCSERKLARPRFGIINDGAPQAFTYGHIPGNARIVLSAGIFELLDEDEVNAVIAHEIGHAVHWDMLVMTLAQLVPMVLYYIYRSMMHGSSEGKSNAAIAVGAYFLYIVSEYIVLWLSRNREYHADRFSGEVTGNPSLLASALVKIAYGLAGGDHHQAERQASERNEGFDAIGALGIFNSSAAKGLAISGYDDDDSTLLNKEGVKHAMRWDMWNPWAKWYELHSTHPLVARRLLALSNLSEHMKLDPFIEFDDTPPESYWDEFFLDLLILVLPWIPIVFGGALTAYSMLLGDGRQYMDIALLLCGCAILLKAHYTYNDSYFPRSAISGLLKKVKVSAVRPVPCKIKGTVIGRGIPGYLFSEDFVIQDKTGIMFLDYRQPLAIWEFFFSIFRRKKFDNQAVEVIGWYRRAPMPYVEVKELISENGDSVKSWVPILYRLTGVVCIVAGFTIGFVLKQ